MSEYALAALVVALATAACVALFPLVVPTDLVMVYLVGTMVVAMRGRRGPALLASLLSVLSFNFFCVPPRFTFHVAHDQYLVTFAVMLAVAVVISQLTFRVNAQAQAAKRAEVQAETERLRSSLLSAVSHDLKTPLAAIIGSASSLLQASPQSPAKGRELLENIRDEAERLSRLVQNLIETTRLEAGVRLRKEPYPIEELFGAALERLDKALGRRKVTTELPEDLPLVPVDAVLMGQVLMNLLENAARHTPEGTEISVSARLEAGGLEVRVADRGPGLAEADLERVFERFYRAKGAASGAGLGLAICKAVVEAHGGRIRAENRPEGGAAFRLWLPLQEKA